MAGIVSKLTVDNNYSSLHLYETFNQVPSWIAIASCMT